MKYIRPLKLGLYFYRLHDALDEVKNALEKQLDADGLGSYTVNIFNCPTEKDCHFGLYYDIMTIEVNGEDLTPFVTVILKAEEKSKVFFITSRSVSSGFPIQDYDKKIIELIVSQPKRDFAFIERRYCKTM